MENEGTIKWIIGFIGTAILGIYGLFINHNIRHVDKEDLQKLWDREDIQKLWQGKQDKASCQEIVKRIDENHKETCKKLDRILEKLGQ